ncbi:MAG: hypothetical protein AB7O24_01600 [Kofleriaceae bacterium]
MQEAIQVGYQAFVSDGGETFGAVREVSPSTVVVYVENAGDFAIPTSAIHAVHHQKVVFDAGKLEPTLIEAIGHAHEAEEPGM